MRLRGSWWVMSSAAALFLFACSSSDARPPTDASVGGAPGNSGGKPSSGGATPGTGGAATSTGGVPATGGTLATGGATGGAGGTSAGGKDAGGEDAGSRDAGTRDAGTSNPDAGGDTCGTPQKLQGVVQSPPFALFIMQDRSSSMVTGVPAPANPDGWTNATAAVTALVNDVSSTGMSVGLGAFPPVVGVADCSAGLNCGSPIVPIAALPGNAAAMVGGMQSAIPPAAPIALTPMECGLRGMISGCASHTAASGMPCAGVLVTDGTPTECSGDPAVLASIVSLGLQQGTRTFVVGMPGSNAAALDQLAQAGGTTTAIDAGSSAQSFARAMITIRDRARPSSTTSECQWLIPAPPSGSTLNKGKVNVRLVPRSGPARQLGYVTPANCAGVVDGWHFDDDTNPKAIVSCPATCQSITAGPDVEAYATFGCERVPATPN